jgi:hypothetical protein
MDIMGSDVPFDAFCERFISGPSVACVETVRVADIHLDRPLISENGSRDGFSNVETAMDTFVAI